MKTYRYLYRHRPIHMTYTLVHLHITWMYVWVITYQTYMVYLGLSISNNMILMEVNQLVDYG